MERRTPFYDYHLRNANRLIKGGGDFMFPEVFTSNVEEHINVRTNVGMQDLSTMGEVDVKGPGAERLLNQLCVNDIRDLVPGQARYSTMVNEQGGVVDDITVYKFGDEHFMVVTSSGPRKKTARWISERAYGHAAYITDVTAAIALPVVQGPKSREFLASVIKDANIDINKLKFFRFLQGTINETPVIVSRSGYTGELGFELYTPAEEAGALWDYLLQAGKPFGLKPYGALTMQTLRLEKAFPLYGVDITEDLTPFHMGLDKWIRFDKREFVGREALLRLQERGIQQRFVGLTLQSEVPANVKDKVYAMRDVSTFKDEKETGPEAGNPEDTVKGGVEVGYITYSNRGHSVGKVLALAYVNISHSYPGARLVVNIAGRQVAATVTPTPFFDPGGIRLRG
jgi:aminomethyltransferase